MAGASGVVADDEGGFSLLVGELSHLPPVPEDAAENTLGGSSAHKQRLLGGSHGGLGRSQ